jgi:hypothetical protein
MSEDLERLGKSLDELEKRVSKIEALLESRPIDDLKKKLSIKEFILQKKPRNDVEKALAIAYYLERHEDFSCFNAMDIEKGFRDAKEVVPANVADKIQKNVAKGHMMEAEGKKDDHKAYVLTNSGDTLVEDDFGKKMTKSTAE